jgi:hypothetical protein
MEITLNPAAGGMIYARISVTGHYSWPQKAIFLFGHNSRMVSQKQIQLDSSTVAIAVAQGAGSTL